MSYKVKSLHIYPVKSLAGISVPHAKALFAGFEHDRRWMLLDENHKFITQREEPKLALFIPSLHPNSLEIQYQNELLTVGFDQRKADTISTQVWDDTAATVVVSDEANEWFSKMLGRKVILVKIHSEVGRVHHSINKNVDLPVSLADGYPYLVAGTASLDLLNSKLIEPVPMDRFRPNIVLETTNAHEEDNWAEGKLGNVNFQNMKPCGRCTVITIDQSNAKINNETLRILNTYRKSGNSVLFGTNMMCTNEGIVKVGDDFFTGY
jgi:uncharacterized protein